MSVFAYCNNCGGQFGTPSIAECIEKMTECNCGAIVSISSETAGATLQMYLEKLEHRIKRLEESTFQEEGISMGTVEEYSNE